MNFVWFFGQTEEINWLKYLIFQQNLFLFMRKVIRLFIFGIEQTCWLDYQTKWGFFNLAYTIPGESRALSHICALIPIVHSLEPISHVTMLKQPVHTLVIFEKQPKLDSLLKIVKYLNWSKFCIIRGIAPLVIFFPELCLSVYYLVWFY